MVRDGRLREPERLGQLADADRLAGVDEQVHDPDARRLAERAEQARRRAGLLVGEHGRRQRRATGASAVKSTAIDLMYRSACAGAALGPSGV